MANHNETKQLEIVLFENGRDKLLFSSDGQLRAINGTDDGGYTDRWVMDMRGKTCALCERSWEVTVESFRDYIQVEPMGHVHLSCWRRYESIRNWGQWHRRLCKFGYPVGSSHLVTNPYDKDLAKRAVFPLEHVWGLRITAGCRRRVDEIVFEHLPRPLGSTLMSVFADYPHTKHCDIVSQTYTIHCYDDAEIEGVLQRFAQAVIDLERQSLTNPSALKTFTALLPK